MKEIGNVIGGVGLEKMMNLFSKYLGRKELGIVWGCGIMIWFFYLWNFLCGSKRNIRSSFVILCGKGFSNNYLIRSVFK